MNFILSQLAHSTLLPQSLSAAVLEGKIPQTDVLIEHLVIASLDAQIATRNDKNATWIERRVARQLLAMTFLGALILERLTESLPESGSSLAVQEGNSYEA